MRRGMNGSSLLTLKPLRFCYGASFVFVVVCGLMLQACAPIADQRGHKWKEEIAAQIKENVTTQDQVQDMMGSPSFTSKYGETTWYYVMQNTTRRAFFHPTVQQHTLFILGFDEKGRVKRIDKSGGDALQEVPYFSQKTPSQGSQTGFFEQIFGNFGRIHRGAGNAP